jgi:cyclopropane fatty-acyl-phospholipid synthase-like methyltransferase
MDNNMGPNVLWLTEWLCSSLELNPGMRVLDLGCGTALSSVFLAREYGVRVWAVDLWVDPGDNWTRIREQGAEDSVCPLRAEAHALPFAPGFFDAMVSADAYHYFGTDDLYLGYVSRFVKPGGLLAMVSPGLMQAWDGDVPGHLMAEQANGGRFWEDESICFHTAAWWKTLWERSNRLDVTVADTLPDGWKHWRDFEHALEARGKNRFPSVAETLDRDQGRYVGFVRTVGIRRSGEDSLNLYEPGLLARFT